MAPPILYLTDIHMSFGGTPLLEGADLTLYARDRLALVGRNGCGKSTLLKIAAGEIEPDKGERFIQPGTTLRYLSQEPDLSGYTTLVEYVSAGSASEEMDHEARYLLAQIGLSADLDPATLSGGEARRAAIAQAIISAPDILLLDEPTNHLDLPTIQWLEDTLRQTNSALILISHDRRFLGQLSQKTLWINLGETRQLDQGFDKFEAWRDEQLELEELDQHKLARKAVREAHWLRYGVTARRKRNQRRLRDLHELRDRLRHRKRQPGKVAMTASEAEASGKRVLEAKDIAKRYGDLTIVQAFSTRVQRGDRIGIIGPNGAGKTTLINLLTGVLPPDEGSLQLGANLHMITLDQKREDLNPDWSLAETLTEGRGDRVTVNGLQKHVVAYMKDFLFPAEQAGTPVHALSGGERGRLMLARALAKPSNLLVLDEPTNDLDLETLDLLQEVLNEYGGTVLLVSHDRDFLDRIVTSVIAYEGEGRWQEYAGGYSDMLAQRGTDLHKQGGTEKPKQDGNPKPGKEARQKSPKSQTQKLTYKDKHALETLPAEIERLSEEIERLNQKMADPELFQKDPDGFTRAAAELSKIETARNAAEERWLELELKREEIEGA